MSTPAAVFEMSLRKHPVLKDMFKAAEARHLTKDELNLYCKTVPQNLAHARAAAEMAKFEAKVVKKTIEEILDLYPVKQHHEMAYEKGIRDMSLVGIYAVQTMLMNDPQWFADKLLIWLKTILQSFQFPSRQQEEQKKSLFARKLDKDMLEILRHADTLPKHRAMLYTAYARLRQHYRGVLSPETWALMEAPLQQAVDILASE